PVDHGAVGNTAVGAQRGLHLLLDQVGLGRAEVGGQLGGCGHRVPPFPRASTPVPPASMSVNESNRSSSGSSPVRIELSTSWASDSIVGAARNSTSGTSVPNSAVSREISSMTSSELP